MPGGISKEELARSTLWEGRAPSVASRKPSEDNDFEEDGRRAAGAHPVGRLM